MDLNPVSAMKWQTLIVLGLLSMATLVFDVTEAQSGGPIPAPNLPEDCNSLERCCMPKPYTGKPLRQFEYETNLPMRVRRPAHLVDKDYVAKLEKAYAILRALPDSDPRSLLNQMRLHCLYCDNGLYFEGAEYPLEIHHGWFFLPWHRMFMYFHERILAKILNDDSFALPFWTWDDPAATEPQPMVIPAMYANETSPLWNPVRNKCSTPPHVVDLDHNGSPVCTNKTSEFLRMQNVRLLYSQLVIGAPTPELFYGMPYRLGDFGGGGPGTMEDQPHGTVHGWVGNPLAQAPRRPYDDMGNFGRSAFDPLFYAHHGNVDRVWWVWSKIPGGKRTYPKDSDFLNTQFTFYDENADLVVMNVSQCLDIEKLRYKFEDAPAPWITNGVAAGNEHTIPLCNPLSRSEVISMISSTKFHQSQDVLFLENFTFKVNRPPRRRRRGTEVLEISGLQIPNITQQVHWKTYLFFPQVDFRNGPACPEWVGTYNFIPHMGQASANPGRTWRLAIGPKLVDLGKNWVRTVVVTIVQTGRFPQRLQFARAKIVYDTTG